MKLFQKVAALLVLASAVPLGVVGFQLVASHERAHESEVRARFDETAQHAAERIAADVEGRARLLGQTTAMFPWGGLGAQLNGSPAADLGRGAHTNPKFAADSSLGKGDSKRRSLSVKRCGYCVLMRG